MFWRRKSIGKAKEPVYKGRKPNGVGMPLLPGTDDDLVAMFSGKGNKVSAQSSRLPPPPAEEQPE